MFSDCADTFMVWYNSANTGFDDPWYGYPVSVTLSVSLTSLNAAATLNTGDTAYDLFMNSASVSEVTIRSSYLSQTFIATTSINPSTKVANFTGLLNNNYIITVSRSGYMKRDIAVTVAGNNLDLGNKELIPGDVFVDGVIDGSDSETLFSKIGQMYGDLGYLTSNDFNRDGIIDGTDTETLFAHIGNNITLYGEVINYNI